MSKNARRLPAKTVCAPMPKLAVIRRFGELYVADDLERKRRVTEGTDMAAVVKRVGLKGYVVA